MRLLDQIVGHQDTIEKILHSFEDGKPGQTFMFVGSHGIGKKQTALGLAQALLCEKNRRACGQCAGCLRVEKNHHESLRLVEADGPQIKIDQAREVIDWLSLRSLGENRVVVIDQAQTMNPQAANSLLKILEEPPAGTFFFLIAPSPAGILPTLKSRSRVVHFKPITPEQMLTKENAPTWMIKASGGSFEKLKDLHDPAEQQTRLKAVEMLQLFLKDADFLTNENWRSFFKDRVQAQKIMSYWVSFLRDAVFFIHQAKSQVVNVDQVAVLQTLSLRSADELLSLIHKCQRSEAAFNSNQDAVLLLEKIWVNEKDRKALLEGSAHVD